MAEKSFRLEVITPERIVMSDEVEFVVVPGVEGELGVLANHAPMIAGLRIGVIRYFNDEGQERHLAMGGGFVEVLENEVTVLAETAEQGNEIDILRAKAAKERAERRLSERAEQINYARAQMALQRALARIRAAEAELI